MRRPAAIKPWLSSQDLQTWVREARDRNEYQKRLAIWLTFIGPYPAHHVATLLGISKQAVWLWLSEYNRRGPEGLERAGRGGRRWAFLSWEREEEFLASLQERAQQGKILTAPQIHAQLCQASGKKVSLAYVYRLLRRHRWRKLGPRPRHVRASRPRQEEFKKNSPNSSKKR
ncbi:MAG: winged helix-turn-helix domain-containing protein [Terriglobia bacterium]